MRLHCKVHHSTPSLRAERAFVICRLRCVGLSPFILTAFPHWRVAIWEATCVLKTGLFTCVQLGCKVLLEPDLLQNRCPSLLIFALCLHLFISCPRKSLSTSLRILGLFFVSSHVSGSLIIYRSDSDLLVISAAKSDDFYSSLSSW
jgi:hypothetical protein